MIAGLPGHDPATALAELTACVSSINVDPSFTAGRRARILMELDVAAQRFWRPMGADFLAPQDKPLEGRDGAAALLKALQASAAEFSAGFAHCVDKEAWNSAWVKSNRVAVVLRRARWLTRKMILSRMLNLPGADERWTELNEFFRFAVGQDLVRNVAPVFPGNPRGSSVKQEYLRMLLVDITRPDRMLGRDMELAFRLIGRITSSVRLESEPIEGADHFIVPVGGNRPVAMFRHSGKVPEGAWYLYVANALPRLQKMLEGDAGADGAEPDPLFSMLFTIRERRALIKFMIDQWGARPAQRRAPRIAMKGGARVMEGIGNLAQVIQRHDQGGFNAESATPTKLRIEFDRSVTISRNSVREIPSELTDASASGMGISLSRGEAHWAKVGALVGVLTTAGGDWAVGVIRRSNAKEQQLDLGISVLTRKPRLVWCERDETNYAGVWDDEKRFERNFNEHFLRGILLEPPGEGFDSGEMLFPPGAATRGTRFEMPVKNGRLRLTVTAIREETHDFQRVAFDVKAI